MPADKMPLTRHCKCPAESTLEVIGGRWKIPILWHLLQGTRRFSELRRGLGGVTQKMLTQQLREMESQGILARKAIHRYRQKSNIA